MRLNCEICDGTQVLPLNETRNSVEAVACCSCGLVWNQLMPHEQQMLDFYEHDYRGHQILTRSYLLSMLSRAACIVEFLQDELQPHQRHLDIGCAEGTLLALTRSRGLQVTGMEVDEHFSRFARETRDLEIVAQTLENAPFAPSSFDLISLVHVVEHLHEPTRILAQARALLQPEGRLFIEVPNLRHPSPGPHSFFCSVHNFYFSPNTLTALVSKAGFAVEKIATSPRDGSLQLLARPLRPNEIAPSTPRDAASEIYALIKRNRRLYYLTLRFITRKIQRQRVKGWAARQYAELLPQLVPQTLPHGAKGRANVHGLGTQP